MRWRGTGEEEPTRFSLTREQVGHLLDLLTPMLVLIILIGTSLIAQLVKNLPAMQETLVRFLSQEDPLEKGWGAHSSILGLPCGLAGKESTCNVGDLGFIPGLGRFPGERKGYPVQYFGLENSVDCIVHGVTKSQTGLSNFHFNIILSWQDLTSQGSHTVLQVDVKETRCSEGRRHSLIAADLEELGHSSCG